MPPALKADSSMGPARHRDCAAVANVCDGQWARRSGMWGAVGASCGQQNSGKIRIRLKIYRWIGPVSQAQQRPALLYGAGPDRARALLGQLGGRARATWVERVGGSLATPH